MKTKLFLLSAGFLVCSFTVNAQSNRCGTMQNLELEMKEDPNRAARYAQSEIDMQQMMIENPGGLAQAMKQAQNLSSIPGFSKTGNVAQDLQNYKMAKAALYEDQENYKATIAKKIDQEKVTSNKNKRSQYSTYQTLKQ